MKKGYTISELEKLTGLSRRNIRFYVSEGLVQPPSGSGVAASYSEEHLERLKMIITLSSRHIKLAGIKKILEGRAYSEHGTDSNEIADKSKTEIIDMIRDARIKEETSDSSVTEIPSENDEDFPETDSKSPGYTGEPLLPKSFFSLSSGVSKFNEEKARLAIQKLVVSQLTGEDREKNIEPEKWLKIKVADGFEINVEEELYKRNKNVIQWIINKIKLQ